MIGYHSSGDRPGVWALFGLVIVWIAVASVLPAEDPPVVYDVTDITGWTPAQLVAVPFFRHGVLVNPTGNASFQPHARLRSGAVVGEVDSGTQHYGVYYQSGQTNHVNPLGRYNWSYWSWDGSDWHNYYGYVTVIGLYDINASGIAVGESSLSGNGDSSLDWRSTAIAVASDTPTSPTEIFSGYDRATAYGINDDGMIVGWAYQVGQAGRAFRLAPGGEVELLESLGGNAEALKVNSAGLAVGSAYEPMERTTRAVAFPPGSTSIIDLGVPDTGPTDSAAARDVNGAGVICGASWEKTQSYEHFAAVWLPAGPGQWQSWDVNEMLSGGDYILEDAIAVNEDGCLLVRGRPDGTDARGSGLYVLTPQGTDWPATDPTNGWIVY